MESARSASSTRSTIPRSPAREASCPCPRTTRPRTGGPPPPAGMGFTLGAKPDTLERIVAQLEAFAKGRKAVLVGWSLGGIYAREAAKLRPDLVAKVVTLGTPFSGNPRANNAWRLYELIAGHKVDHPPIDTVVSEKPPVPTIAIWSPRDGIVAPASARG